VYFDARGRVDLARAGWNGPPAQWLARHGLHAVALPVRRTDTVVPGTPARRTRRML
jgi:hypothetical protein